MRFSYIALFLLLLAPTSFADISNETIRNYNKAVTEATSVEDVSSAAQALASEAIANPEGDTSALLAFEAAWTLCQIGECEKGLDAAKFSAAQEAKSTDEYPSQETRTVLTNFMTWKLDNSDKNRKALVSALSTLKDGDVSQITLAAHREHYLYCTQKGAWRDAARAAGAAAQHTASLKSEIFDEYALAEMTRLTAEFQLKKTPRIYRELYDLEDELLQRYAELGSGNPETHNETLTTIYHRVIALKGAVNAYLSSTGDENAVKRISAARPERDINDDPDDEFCEGSIIVPPTLTYPTRALEDGLIGSLVMGFTIDHGKPKDIEVLAAIPEGVFEEEALKAMKEVEWAPTEGIDTSTCSMVRENYIYPIVFRIGN